MNIDWLALDRATIGEILEPVDKLHDAVGLVADQTKQGEIVTRNRSFEQLSSTSDARKRVFYFMRQHRTHRRDRACCSAMRHLPVHFFSNCLFLQHNDDIAGIIRLERGEKIDNLIKADAGRADINAVLADATALPAHLLH